MHPFRHLSIRRKLTLVILLTSTITLVLACLSSIAYEYIRARQTIVRDLSTQAEIIGANCNAALAFNDPKAAQETLGLLEGRRGILSGRIYRTDGTVFAEYVRPGVEAPALPRDRQQEGYEFKGGRVRASHRIFFGRDDVGAVSLWADLHEQQASLLDNAGIALAIMLALMVLSLFLSTWLQRFISEPILALARVARAVSLKKDYSLRVTKQTDDEIGLLAEDFNRMLADIERHNSELRASEERFRQIAENIRGVFWMKNLATNQILYVSPAYEMIWGRPREQLYQSWHDWEVLIHPEDQERVRNAALYKLIRGEYDEVYRIVRSDGSVRWIRDRGFPIRNDKGQIYRIAGIAEDVTERKQAEAELLEKDQRLRAVVNSAPIVVFAINQQGIITTEEGHALHDVRTRPGFNVGRHLTEVFPNNTKVIENINRSLITGEEYTTTVELAEQVFSTWYAPQRDESGNIIGVMGVATNVTERFQLERQVLDISDREQARIGQDLHDGLCQHLVGIAFAANALEETLAARGLAEAAAAREITSLLDDAISQARNTARGLYPVKLEAEGLASALGELAANVNSRFGLDCRLDYPEPVPLSDNAATIQLYRIAQEAVANVVKHAGAREIVIRLTRNDGRVSLCISDDGVGIAEPMRNHRGMGLNIMEYRARTVGGALRVRRGPEGGTEVTCSILDRVAERKDQNMEARI